MPTEKVKNPIPSIEKLAIVAGSGRLPAMLVSACKELGIEPFVVGIEGQTDESLKKEQHVWMRLGAAGEALKTLRKNGVRDMVMIGAVRRPSLSEVRLDSTALSFFKSIGFKALGDDNLLRLMRTYLEDKEGFQFHGVHTFMKDLLAPEGVIGGYEPSEQDWRDIIHGFHMSQALGAQDIGQSVVVQRGIVLAVEAIEGTDELIRRSGLLKRKGGGGVLVKTCKPAQDRDLDLPTIGPDTVDMVAQAGLAGIAVHAGASLMVDPDEISKRADRHKIFVVGVTKQ